MPQEEFSGAGKGLGVLRDVVPLHAAFGTGILQAGMPEQFPEDVYKRQAVGGTISQITPFFWIFLLRLSCA